MIDPQLKSLFSYLALAIPAVLGGVALYIHQLTRGKINASYSVFILTVVFAGIVGMVIGVVAQEWVPSQNLLFGISSAAGYCCYPIAEFAHGNVKRILKTITDKKLPNKK